MTQEVDIAESTDRDMEALAVLYRETFPDEDLMPIVREVITGEADYLSVVARRERAVVGHVLFTMCGIDGQAGSAALLAPLGVSPGCQRQGIGRALVAEGFRRLENGGVTHVYVLGDPAYYGRFGFKVEAGVPPLYALPEDWRDAWQSIGLHGSNAAAEGKLIVPMPWQRPELWTD